MSAPAAKATKCATCRRVAPPRPGNKFFPFCCERCQMADLGRWLTEDYRIPDETTPVTGPDDDS